MGFSLWLLLISSVTATVGRVDVTINSLELLDSSLLETASTSGAKSGAKTIAQTFKHLDFEATIDLEEELEEAAHTSNAAKADDDAPSKCTVGTRAMVVGGKYDGKHAMVVGATRKTCKLALELEGVVEKSILRRFVFDSPDEESGPGSSVPEGNDAEGELVESSQVCCKAKGVPAKMFDQCRAQMRPAPGKCGENKGALPAILESDLAAGAAEKLGFGDGERGVYKITRGKGMELDVGGKSVESFRWSVRRGAGEGHRELWE